MTAAVRVTVLVAAALAGAIAANLLGLMLRPAQGGERLHAGRSGLDRVLPLPGAIVIRTALPPAGVACAPARCGDARPVPMPVPQQRRRGRHKAKLLVGGVAAAAFIATIAGFAGIPRGRA